MLDSLSKIVTFETPIDLLGALSGGIIGLILVLVWDWISHPKVRFLGFVHEQVNFGTLYKLRFKITGRQNPGICQLKIQWNGNSVKAKWDETSTPLEVVEENGKRIDIVQDSDRDWVGKKFLPHAVPATFYQPLFLNLEYKVPIIHQKDENCKSLSVFSGWWFGRKEGYGPNPSVNKNTELTLILSGNNFQWSKKVKVSEITNERS